MRILNRKIQPKLIIFFFIYEFTDEIDNKPNKYLVFHKCINFIFLFLSVYSHLKTSITDPGSITCNNNKEIIEFFYHVHEPFIKRALYITEKKTPEVIKKIILGNQENNDKNEDKNESKDEDKYIEENESDKDDYDFEAKTSINEEIKGEIEEKYHMKLSRCLNCFVIRPINAHHCSVCHKCYIDQDHHCPWVNNCIGLFNKKMFILFLCYIFIEVIYSDFLFFYYSLYKNIDKFQDSPGIIVMDVFAILFGLILAIVSVMLLFDQYDTIKSNCTEIDFKKGILLEKSTVKQQFQIIFGGIYSYKWLLPFYPGGFSESFKQLYIYLKEKQSMKIHNKNNKDEEILENKEKDDSNKNIPCNDKKGINNDLKESTNSQEKPKKD